MDEAKPGSKSSRGMENLRTDVSEGWTPRELWDGFGKGHAEGCRYEQTCVHDAVPSDLLLCFCKKPLAQRTHPRVADTFSFISLPAGFIYPRRAAGLATRWRERACDAAVLDNPRW